jgi:hypothetical protein
MANNYGRGNMSPAATDNKIKLEGYEDWDRWNAVFIARASFLWDKIDPVTAAPQPPFLTPPSKPSYASMIMPGPDQNLELRQRYEVDRDTYLMNLAEFEAEDRALIELKTWVAETVGKHHFSALCGAEKGIAHWYASLRSKFAGDHALRYAMAEARFKAALEGLGLSGPVGPVGERIMAWLDEWEYAIAEAQSCEVPLACNPNNLWTVFASVIHDIEELQEWFPAFKRANEEVPEENKLTVRELCDDLRCTLIREGIVRLRRSS